MPDVAEFVRDRLREKLRQIVAEQHRVKFDVVAVIATVRCVPSMYHSLRGVSPLSNYDGGEG